MNTDVIGMATFVFVGAVTPGPVNLVALRYGIGGGMTRPLGYTIGASVSYGALLWLTGMGAGPLLAQPQMAHLLRWVGAAYLFYLAWRIATAPLSEQNGETGVLAKDAWSALLEGGLFQLFNPKAWLVALSGVTLFTTAKPGDDSALLLFCTISIFGCAVGVGLWAGAGRLIKEWLASAHRQRRFNRMLGAALGASVIAMLS